MHHHLAIGFYIAAVAADIAIDADIPDLLFVFGLAAAAAQVDLVPPGAGFADGIHRRGGQAVLVVHQSAVDINEQDLVHKRFLPYVVF